MSYAKEVALRILESKKERFDHYKELVTEYFEEELIRSSGHCAVVSNTSLKSYIEYGDVSSFLSWLQEEGFEVNTAGDFHSISVNMEEAS